MNDPIVYPEALTLAHTVGELLKRHKLMCATAESCTGGLVGHLITEIVGSSAWYAGSAVAYSYEAKERLLRVEQATLERDGAVSYAIAQQMARGACGIFAVDVAVATTGIAGPGGGLPHKPVGTVHVHVSATDGYERGERFVWTSDRSGNKLLSAIAALEMLKEYLDQKR